MTKTENSYISDQGELVLTVDAVLQAIAYFTTAEPVIFDAALRKLEETSPKTREYSEVFVTGDITPIKTMSSKQTATEWTLTVIDDYSSGQTGEFGTDELTVVETFQQIMDNALVIADLACTPAGGATGDIETTLTNVDVKSVTHPPIDADATNPQEVTIMLVVESYTQAAHS
jgi:hypothetical protein